MPYGKYKGIIIADLPEFYLVWYSQKGFPAGKLGMMLSTMYEIKLNGLEYLLKPLRWFIVIDFVLGFDRRFTLLKQERHYWSNAFLVLIKNLLFYNFKITTISCTQEINAGIQLCIASISHHH